MELSLVYITMLARIIPLFIIGLFFVVNPALAEETTTSYGPYSYGTNQETISIPASGSVYIGEIQTDSNYDGNYLEHGGFFVGGYAGNLTVNGVVVMYEENSGTTGTSGHDYTQYYYKAVYEDTSRYREAKTDPYWGSGSSYYHDQATVTDDRRWMNITNLLEKGEDNTFSFYHYTDSTQGYVLKIVTEQGGGEDTVTYINSDFNPDSTVDSQSRSITGTGFNFENFGENTSKKIIKDFFHVYSYNSLWYSDWGGNYYWKWSTDNLLDTLNTKSADGTCFGFAYKAWELYRGHDDVTTYKSSADTTYDLTQSSVEREIKGTYFYQYAKEYENYRVARDQDGSYTVENVYETVKDALNSKGKANIILGLTSAAGGGHAVTPYRIEEQEDQSEALVYVYDSNEPGDEENFITFDLDASPATWTYLPAMMAGSTDGSIFYYDMTALYNDGVTLTFPTMDGDEWGLFALGSTDITNYS